MFCPFFPPHYKAYLQAKGTSPRRYRTPPRLLSQVCFRIWYRVVLITRSRRTGRVISMLLATVNIKHIAFICNVPFVEFPPFLLILVFVEETNILGGRGGMEKLYKMYLDRKLKFIAVAVTRIYSLILFGENKQEIRRFNELCWTCIWTLCHFINRASFSNMSVEMFLL